MRKNSIKYKLRSMSFVLLTVLIIQSFMPSLSFTNEIQEDKQIEFVETIVKNEVNNLNEKAVVEATGEESDTKNSTEDIKLEKISENKISVNDNIIEFNDTANSDDIKKYNISDSTENSSINGNDKISAIDNSVTEEEKDEK